MNHKPSITLKEFFSRRKELEKRGVNFADPACWRCGGEIDDQAEVVGDVLYCFSCAEKRHAMWEYVNEASKQGIDPIQAAFDYKDLQTLREVLKRPKKSR